MRRAILTTMAVALMSCGYFKTEDQADPEPVVPVSPPQQTWVEELRSFKADIVSQMRVLQDDRTGWITDDCDGWIWNAKAVIGGLEGVNLLASEYTGISGKFGRRPPSPRWCYQGQNYGSESTWSRDMAQAGLIPYGLLTADLDILQRHAEFGEANNWVMGDPSSADRVIYSPQLIATLYKVIGHLGGSIPAGVSWITVYPSGLTDYQAHLQINGLLIRSEIDEKLPAIAIDRIEEHASREPNNALYGYMRQRFDSGSYSVVARSLIDGTASKPTYVRCAGQPGCWLAEQAFVATLILREYDD